MRTFPHRCPIAPENAYRDDTIRMQLVGNHLFLFRVDDEQRIVRVFAFRHGAMLPRADELPDD